MKISDYIHYYIGCKVKATPYGGQSNIWEYGNLVGINVHNVANVKFDNWQSVADVSTSCIKPLLRKLDNMTEEEMVGLLQSMLPDLGKEMPTPDDYSLEMFRYDGGNLVDEDIAVGANYTCICYEGSIGIKHCGTIILQDESGEDVTREELINAPAAFHYLLRQGFDLFGLCDAGLAVDKNEIKK